MNINNNLFVSSVVYNNAELEKQLILSHLPYGDGGGVGH